MAECMPRNDGQEIPAPRSLHRGSELAAGAGIPDLPYVRLTQRTPPPRERRRVWPWLALVLVGHALLGRLAYLVLRPAPRANESGVIAVTLIEPAAPLPAPPPLVSPPPLPEQLAPLRHPHYVPPAQGAIQATLESAKERPLKLYEPNGQIRLPSNAPKQPASAPTYSAAALRGSQIYSGKSLLPYQSTRFNKDWVPANQSLGAKAAAKVGEVFGEAVDKTSLKKTVKVGGTRIHCAIAPLLLFAAGCTPESPPPPPKNDDDIRLSMPPPETLTGEKVPLPKATSSAAPPASPDSN